jgi:H+/Cl- antiporter ClcA
MTFWARIHRPPTWWIPIGLVVIVCAAILVQVFVGSSEEPGPSATKTASHSYQSGPESFVQQLRAGRVDSLVIDDVSETIDVTTKAPVVKRYSVSYPGLEELITLLAEPSGVVVTTKEPLWWITTLVLLVPLVLAAAVGGSLGYVLGRRRGRKEAAAAIPGPPPPGGLS